MAFWEADPIVEDKPSAQTEGDWWKSDPVVGESPENVPDEIAQSKAQQEMERKATFPDWANRAATAVTNTAKGFVPHSLGEVPSWAANLATPVTGSIDEMVKDYRIGREVLTTPASLEEATRKYAPERFQLVEAEKTPALSQERFQAASDIIAQMLMMKGIAGGLKGGFKAVEVPKVEAAKNVVVSPEPLAQTDQSAQVVSAPVESRPAVSASDALPQTPVEVPRPSEKEITPPIVEPSIKEKQDLGKPEPQELSGVQGQMEPPVKSGMVRLYHGASEGAGQAGTDFTPSREYAEGYAGKSQNGQVWYVDVPKDAPFLVRDEGSAIPGQEAPLINGQKLPDEIANKAKPLTSTGEPNGPIRQRSTETEIPSPIERGENQQGSGERVRPSEQGQEIAGTSQTPEENQVPLEPSRVGIAHEYGEERFPGEIERGEGTTVEAQVERGRELLQRGVDPGQIVRRVERTGRVSGDDMSVLRAQLETFQHAADTAAEASRMNPGDSVLKRAAEQAMQNELGWRKTIKPAATVFHEIGMTLQGQAEVNYGTLEGLRRSAFDIHGKDVNPLQAARLKEAATRVRRETQLATESLQRATIQIEHTLGRKAPPRSVEQLRNDLANRLRELTPC